MSIYYGHTPNAYQHLSPLKRGVKRLVGSKSFFYTPLLRENRLASLIRGVFFKRGED